MLPILPILILLFLGPANADRLAAEGRLPAALLAVHLARTMPAGVAAVAPVEEAERVASADAPCEMRPVSVRVGPAPRGVKAVWGNPGCPPRAGPSVA